MSNLSFIKFLDQFNLKACFEINSNASLFSDLGNFKSLNSLDLSFNNFIGQIPDSFFKNNNLKKIFIQ